MKKFQLFVAAGLLLSQAVLADVALLEKTTVLHKLTELEKKAHPSRKGGTGAVTDKATGDFNLADSGGLEWFINTDINFTTSSSASGAASEASYANAVSATTSGGGTTSSTLNDAFDGYNAACVVSGNSFVQCQSGGGGDRGKTKGVAAIEMYNQNGPVTTECNGRQAVFGLQTFDSGVTVRRKVFVPSDNQFTRWMNVVNNPTAAPVTLTLMTSNNLGSDNNTVLVTTSSGDATVTAGDTWATSFQNFSGTTSSDVRLGHVFRGNDAPVGLAGIQFVSGDDNPFWGYTLTVQPGQTQVVLNYATGQASKAAAAAKAAELAGFPESAQACMTDAELATVANFAGAPFVAEVPTLNAAGIAALGLALAGAAFALLRRRRAA